MTTTFETAKVGDRVLCIRHGWGEIHGIDSTKPYPIAVCFADNELRTYTVDGFFSREDLNQSLFWPMSYSAWPAEEKQIPALRDQFAIAYMQAQVQAGALYTTWDALAGDAYKIADAMLKERDK